MSRSHSLQRNSLQQSSPLIHTQPAVEEVHVAGLVVHSRPEQLEAVTDWLSAQPGIEIHGQSDQGKLVVVMESRRTRDILELLDTACDQPGIVNVALIYHEVVTQNPEDSK